MGTGWKHKIQSRHERMKMISYEDGQTLVAMRTYVSSIGGEDRCSKLNWMLPCATSISLACLRSWWDLMISNGHFYPDNSLFLEGLGWPERQMLVTMTIMQTSTNEAAPVLLAVEELCRGSPPWMSSSSSLSHFSLVFLHWNVDSSRKAETGSGLVPNPACLTLCTSRQLAVTVL